MSFITDSDLLSAVAVRLKQSGPSALPSHWNDVVSEANAGAYDEILGAFLARGFTQAQINQWDRGAEFQKSIGLFLALTNGGMLDSLDPKMLDKLDRRRDLCTVQMLASGVWQKPQDGQQQGTVTTGPRSNEGAVFNWPDPADENLGEITKW